MTNKISSGSQEKEVFVSKTQQLKMAEKQTVWAAERTLMSWIRTSMSMISFGFVINQFFHWADEASLKIGNFPSKAFGLALIVIGTLTMVLATFQHVRLVRGLGVGTQDKPAPLMSLALGVAILLCLLGRFAFTLGFWTVISDIEAID